MARGRVRSNPRSNPKGRVRTLSRVRNLPRVRNLARFSNPMPRVKQAVKFFNDGPQGLLKSVENRLDHLSGKFHKRIENFEKKHQKLVNFIQEVESIPEKATEWIAATGVAAGTIASIGAKLKGTQAALALQNVEETIEFSNLGEALNWPLAQLHGMMEGPLVEEASGWISAVRDVRIWDAARADLTSVVPDSLAQLTSYVPRYGIPWAETAVTETLPAMLSSDLLPLGLLLL